MNLEPENNRNGKSNLKNQQERMDSHLKLRALCEGAIFVAVAQAVGYLKIFELPQGGSICLGMLPIFLYCVRWGFGPGMLASAAYAVLQLLFDGAYAWSWQSIVGDYLVAFSVLGVSGLFHGVKGGFYWGAAAGSVLRFLCHLVTGATVWAEYMPEKFFGLTMTSPWFYSFLYNGSFIAVDMVLCIVVGALLQKPLGRYMRGEDLGFSGPRQGRPQNV